MSDLAIPAGFVRHGGPQGEILVVRSGDAAAALAGGLDRRATWESVLRGAPRAGRGGVGRVALADGRSWVLKAMHRGGLAGELWRNRFLGTARLIANLEIPGIVRERGVATPAPTALLLVAGPRRLWRAWLATEEIAGGRDLLQVLAQHPPDAEARACDAVRAMREAHDAGLRHPDLHLGNFLVRADSRRPWILDLDGASWSPQPPKLDARRQAMRRLARSYLKRFGEHGPLAAGYFDRWVDAYAEGHPEWRAVLARETPLDRVALAFRKLIWPAAER